MTFPALLKMAILMAFLCAVSGERTENEGSRLLDQRSATLNKPSVLVRKDDEQRETKLEPKIILRRTDGSENFNRPWADYRVGFGNSQGEHWLGLSQIHQLTSERRYRLRVDLTDWSGEKKWAVYAAFSVASEAENYKLSVSGYDASSSAGDSLSSHNDAMFSTSDKDNDKWSSNCASQWKAGWWYTSCYFAIPTGQYKTGPGNSEIRWFHAYNDYRGFKAVTFTIIPVPETVFLRRMDGSEKFIRPWADYRIGFGKPEGEFWLGLEKIHQMTSKRKYILRVDLTDWSGEKLWAAYAQISVASEAEGYKLTVSGYDAESTAGDSMTYHNGMKFSTLDRDNDKLFRFNCANIYKGAWWYKKCFNTNPTGLYLRTRTTERTGVTWLVFKKDYRSYKAVTFTMLLA